MHTHPEFAMFEALDLSPIKTKLMHKQSGEGWTEARANAVEAEYRRFLFIMKKYPDDIAAPNVDVDTFWHYHILDTQKYARDCHALFGFFLHHYPYLGMGDAADQQALEQAGSRMHALYQAEFGGAQASDAAFCAAPGRPDALASAFCAAPGEPVTAAAFCAAPGRPASDAAAFCAAPGRPATQAAFCAAPGRAATDAAFCAAPGRAAAEAAFCAAPGRTTTEAAFCAAPGRPATEAAFCAAPGRPGTQVCREQEACAAC